MPSRIEDYALLGDLRTAALVSKDGSIDWLCLPRFDSPACFAALLGDNDNGRWRIGPASSDARTTRAYRDGTMILETRFETPEGAAVLIDFMPPDVDGRIDLVRIVRGERGSVAMTMDLRIRFGYGSSVPWVTRQPFGLAAIAGPDALELRSPVPMHGRDMTTVANFTVSEGEAIPFVLTWHQSHLDAPPPIDPNAAFVETDRFWHEWSSNYKGSGPYRDAVLRSLLTLKALTYSPTGGIVAAATTSLPEHIGGVRNWDYRYCWLRDATFTLYALVSSGFTDEARDWRNWLLRAVAGKPSQLQTLYGLAGERFLPEFELSWLAGYEASPPVRIGNAASNQFQLDVYGETIDTLHVATRAGLAPSDDVWALQRELVSFVESHWDEPDEGLWEVRGPRQHFTHSRVMAWVALDRSIKCVERFGMKGPTEKWKAIRAEIRRQVCEQGFDSSRGAFVQSFGSTQLDASLLMIPLVGFLPATDPRVIGTVEAIGRELMQDGVIHRYDTGRTDDGLPIGEGAFLACSFWYADNLAMIGRTAEATAMFDGLTAIRNDVGLLAEEYDPIGKRQLGNFPQAFSHVGLINTAQNIADHRGAARTRARH